MSAGPTFLLRWIVRAAACLLVVAAAVTPAEAAKWRTARSENFEMFTAIDTKGSRELLVELERFRTTFQEVFGVRFVRASGATVMVFDRRESFNAYAPVVGGRPRSLGGFFAGGPDENFIALHVGGEIGAAKEVIFHEYVHLLFQAQGLNPPTWVNEGMAELFSTFHLDGDGVLFGRAKPRHLALLRERGLIPVEQLFAVNKDSPEYNEGSRATQFYAQSWALVHYLLCGGDRENRARLGRFLELMERPGAEVKTSFEKAFGHGYEELDRKLAAYVAAGRYREQRAVTPQAIKAGKVKFVAAPERELDLAFINLRWRAQPTPENTAAIGERVARHPQWARPVELLALATGRAGDHARAAPLWQRAVELGSTSALTYFQAAFVEVRDVTENVPADFRIDAEKTARMRALLDRALALEPRFPEAWTLLGQVESFGADVSRANVERLEKIVDTQRDGQRTRLSIALARYRLGDFAAAREAAQAVIITPGTPGPIRLSATAVLRMLPPPSREPAFLRGRRD